ncbi:hypothetical protein [Flavobacterium proteolyticum]|uniref:Outer membrane protein beta-barrel domain-containing protein n=1 Tax=Flavobacterium proteolyticum TaxID=2911683 RepID=A0ABR9WR55_9FLAO|nr:hypothetical protein [Flavobacterium proteolyticum]MBE9575721.1 hypothetical protein [Flavobacterium proteolyticum]
MKEQKNIERLFQEKFKDFDAIPPQGSWDSIASKLNEKKKKKRVVPFWFQVSGIAASLLIIGTLIWNFQSEDNEIILNNNETVVGVDKENTTRGNSEKNKISSDNENNQNTIKENQTNALENNKKQFDSNLINLEKSNTKVVSNENQNTRSNKKNNNINLSGNKKRFYNNIKESNNIVVSNSKTNKTKRSKSSIKNNDNYNLIADNEDYKKTKLVSNKKTKNIISKKETIDSEKINSFFDKTETITNYVNTTNDSLTEKTSNRGSANVILTSVEDIINNDSTLVAEISSEINTLEVLLKEKEAGKNEDEKEKKKRDKWAISTNASPVYFNSLAEGSSLDQEFETNSKNYSTTYSYGVTGIYSISNKVSIRTGINNILFSYNTNDVVYESKLITSAASNNVETITRNAQGNNMNFYSKNSNQNSLNGDVENFTQENIGALKQNVNYIEVPVELSYKLLDKKFGIEVIGGMSTLFLNNNTVLLVTDGMEMNVGKANNLNNIHFSSNVGLGFKYNFWRSFNANFQPMFKYQINTFSENSGNFKPYFIGLYTGVSFSF